MISRYSVWLNDVSLQSVDPDIQITDITYAETAFQVSASQLANRPGLYAGKSYIAENKITVSFEIHKYNTAQRQAALDSVRAWASPGGWLKVGDRPDQRIYVRLTKPPVITSVQDWTSGLTVEFTAYDYPFWQDQYPSVVTLEKDGEDTFFLPCAFDSCVEAKITAGASLTSIEIHVGDTVLALSGLTLSSGDVVTVSYTDDHHVLEIKSGNTSLLDKRTSASSDDLIAKPGNNSLSFTASASAECELYFKGVYL